MWAGHLARLPPPRLAKQALLTRNLVWWRRQQQNPQGFRHTKRSGNISRWENVLGRHHPHHASWHESARFRDRWKMHYPTFEKRLFGETSPHDFQSAPPQIPPSDGLSPRNELHPKQSPNTEGAPASSGKSLRDREGTREGTGHPMQKLPRSEGHGAPTKGPSLTPTQIAKKWEQKLDAPLLNLAVPKVSRHGRHAGRSRLRSRVRVGHLDGQTSPTTPYDRTDQALSSQDGQDQAGSEWRGGHAARPSSRTGHGSGRVSQEGAYTQDRCASSTAHRRGPATNTSTNTSSSTSTSSSASTSSDAKAACKNKGKGKGKRRTLGKGKGQSKIRTEGARAPSGSQNGGTSRVLSSTGTSRQSQANATAHGTGQRLSPRLLPAADEMPSTSSTCRQGNSAEGMHGQQLRAAAPTSCTCRQGSSAEGMHGQSTRARTSTSSTCRQGSSAERMHGQDVRARTSTSAHAWAGSSAEGMHGQATCATASTSAHALAGSSAEGMHGLSSSHAGQGQEQEQE